MTDSDRRLISRIARDHGLTPEQLAKAVREQPSAFKPGWVRHSVGEG